MKKIFIAFCFFIILAGVVNIIFAERDTFAQKYDEEYWKDRFEHSQWVLPLSKRIIGDDGLYAHIGYRLIQGGSLDGYNAEVPPLGKYFIGLSILVFDNPYYFALFFGIGSLCLFYLISKRVLKNTVGAYFAVSLLFLDPFFFSQFWKSALDIYQLFFLLLHILLFINFVNQKDKNRRKLILYVLACGFSLGLFSQVKYPLIFPILFITEALYFLLKKEGKEYLVYLIGACTAFLFVNVKFFLDGNSLIDFFKLQKYILSFYLKSQLAVHNEAIWQTLFLGRFPDISNRGLISIHEWWIMWPFAAIASIFLSIASVFRKSTSSMWRGFGFFLLGTFIIYTFIPSYPRYLVIVFPFIYLFFVRSIQGITSLKLKYILMIIILCFGLSNARAFLKDDSSIILNNFYYNFSHQYFQDVYQENLVSEKELGSREKFRLIVQEAMGDAEIKSIKIEEVSKHIEKEKGNITLKVTYFTQSLGDFSEIKVLNLIKENNKWKIAWSWDLVFDGFLPEYYVETKRITGKRGAIIDSGGKILVQDSKGYLVSVNPEKIDLNKEGEMLKFISGLGNVEAPYLQNAYLENSMPGEYVPLITLFFSLKESDKNKLLSFPGVSLTTHSARIYNRLDFLSVENTLYKECCTRIYSSYSYHGVEGLEKEYDLDLSGYDGGSIIMKDKFGKIVKTVLKKKAKNGRDITVPL